MEPVIRDSAGVRIVENGAAPPGAWRAAERPLFALGWNPGDPAFSWPQSGRLLPDGGALVGEFSEGTLYRIGPDGSVVDRWGRKGTGPGEYQGFDAISLHADSIFVSDRRLERLTVLSSGGEVMATRPLPGAFVHQLAGVMNAGRLLLVPADAYRAVADVRQEWVFETQPILAADPLTGAVDTLIELPHMRRWYGDRGGAPGPVQVKGRAGGFSDGFAWARSDVPEVRWYDGAGTLVQIARWQEEPVPLTAETRERIAESGAEALRSRGVEDAVVEAQLRELAEGFDRHGGPLPYWQSLHVDRLGNVWLSEYAVAPSSPARWRVVARDGRFLGWVELGETLSILDITDDRMLTVRQDSMDVLAVQMLELIK